MEPFIVDKDWGREIVYHNDEKYCLKKLIIDAGWMCSLHYHAQKEETFLVIQGQVYLVLPDETGRGFERHHLSPGDSRTVLPETPHRFYSRLGAAMIEASTKHSDNDVVRLDPSRRLTEFEEF